jgi:predicted metal-dependent hydrolase
LANVKAFVESKKDWIARQVAVLRDTRLLEPSAILNPEHARAHLFARLETLSQLHGFAYAKAAVRSQKSRWGSCSPKNTISLNIRLYLLPPRLADYVILHELVHTRIKDHGPTFWKLLEERMTDAKARDRELRRFRLT